MGLFLYYFVFKSWVFEHTITSCSQWVGHGHPILQIVKVFSLVCGIWHNWGVFSTRGKALHFILFHCCCGLFWFICLFACLLQVTPHWSAELLKTTFLSQWQARPRLILKMCMLASASQLPASSLWNGIALTFVIKNTAICPVKPQNEKSTAQSMRTAFPPPLQCTSFPQPTVHIWTTACPAIYYRAIFLRHGVI